MTKHTFFFIILDDTDFLGGECGPNWELLAPRGNRFYFPNAVGPAWQSASTTINLEAPLESIVDFDGKVIIGEYIHLDSRMRIE